MNLPVRIYARISKNEKDDRLYTHQINYLTEYAQRHGLKLEDPVYEDLGHTGRNIERPGYQWMLKDVKLGYRFGILCTNVDRLNRNEHEAIHLMELCLENNMPIISTTQEIDVFTARGRFVYKLYSLMADYESDLISERTRHGLKRRRSSGKEKRNVY